MIPLLKVLGRNIYGQTPLLPIKDDE